MSEIPTYEKTVNPIKDLAVQKINSIFQNKLFEQKIPLQEGFLFWKKNYTLFTEEPALKDLINELGEKGYNVVYIPRSDIMYRSFGCNKYTNITVKPSETEKTTIIISNDE